MKHILISSLVALLPSATVLAQDAADAEDLACVIVNDDVSTTIQNESDGLEQLDSVQENGEFDVLGFNVYDIVCLVGQCRLNLDFFTGRPNVISNDAALASDGATFESGTVCTSTGLAACGSQSTEVYLGFGRLGQPYATPPMRKVPTVVCPPLPS